MPIEIKPKVIGTEISNKVVNRQLRGSYNKVTDKVFLFYDLDREEILGKLIQIENAVVLASNPCCELWFKLHHQNHAAYIVTDVCIRSLIRIWPQYSKGSLTDQMKADLRNGQSEAIARSKRLNEYDNPSTTVYRLIEELEKVDK
ncbi:RloB family protein [Carboxylicivirga marina]|uniref:RloB domain-containing protein n=1 Tax=Carboxylicivirga marina TaxID=2800988 RepID=A0ABS1HQP3_9BACT|nr:RloB family protein [Carboxylicivirga marina]MBK3519911.1 RloB domain-containing protein [Carboxylicivirga marina]